MGELVLLFIDGTLEPELLEELKMRLLKDRRARRRFIEFVVDDAKLMALGRIGKLLGVPWESICGSGVCECAGQRPSYRANG